MEKGNYKIFSFFAGCGQLDLGFEKAGFEIVFVNEYFRPFMDAYIFSRKRMGVDKPQFGYWNTNINSYLQEENETLRSYMKQTRSDGSLVGFIGGPPCPDFSVAGKQKGREGDNGKLSESYVSLITDVHPDFFMFENVKGLWRTARHREYYEELKQKLTDSGYCLTDRLTNALEFGVPQDRDRILLVGISRDLLKEEYISDNSELLYFPWEKNIRYSLDDVKNEPWPVTDVFKENSERRCPNGIHWELTVEHWFRKNDVERHYNADQYFKPKAGLQKMLVIPEGDTGKKSYKRLHRWRYSPTVCYGNNEVHLHPYKARRLSVAEALALQSLPKEFCLPRDMTLTNAFKTIGNGVPYLMAEGVAETIRDYLKDALKITGGTHEENKS